MKIIFLFVEIIEMHQEFSVDGSVIEEVFPGSVVLAKAPAAAPNICCPYV